MNKAPIGQEFHANTIIPVASLILGIMYWCVVCWDPHRQLVAPCQKPQLVTPWQPKNLQIFYIFFEEIMNLTTKFGMEPWHVAE